MNLCNHPWAVGFNKPNGVVQCYVCGHVWVPLAAENDEAYRLAVETEEKRLKHAEPAREVHEWLHPAGYRREVTLLPQVGEEWEYLGNVVKVLEIHGQMGSGPNDYCEAVVETRFGERATTPVSELSPKSTRHEQ